MQITLEQLLEAGAHFGHQTKRWNPKMASYIYASHNGVHIFDLAKTREALLEAGEIIRKTVETGGVVLFVGTKRQAKEFVTEAAKKVGMPYVTNRWLGGMLTNFEQIRKSVKKLEDLRKGRTSGEFDQYTKKERLLLDREIARLERILGGVEGLKKLPDLMFVVDTHEEKSAVHEANRLNIPVVGIVDTNADPTTINYPVPANDDAVRSISLLVDFIREAVEEGQGKGLVDTETKKESKSKTKKVKSEIRISNIEANSNLIV